MDASPATVTTTDSSATARRHLLGAAAVGLGYWLLARYSLDLPVKASGISYIWPADGLALGALLCTPRRYWLLYLVAVFAGNFAASTKAAQLNVLYSLFNVAEPLLVALVVTRVMGPRPCIDSLRCAASLLVGIMATMAATVLLTNGLDWAVHRGDFWRIYGIWYVSDTLGMLVIAPLVIALTTHWHVEWDDATMLHRLEAAVLVVGAVAATWYVFGRAPREIAQGFNLALTPLLVPTIFMLWGSVRFGLPGGLVTLSILTLLAFRFTAEGLGPFTLQYGESRSALLHLQVSLMVATVLVLLVAARTVEWRRAHAENTQARRRLEFAIEASGTLAFEVLQGDDIVWSGDVENVLGIARKELATIASWARHVHPDDRERMGMTHQALVTGETPFMNVTYRLVKPGGEEVLVTADAYAVPVPVRDPASPARMNVMGILRNITAERRAAEEQHRLETRLRQAEKLEAIGAMAGGIAHDFNNILSAIVGYAEMLQSRIEAGSRARKYVDTIAAAGDRGKALVAQVLTFTRLRDADRRPVDLRALVGEVTATIRGSLPGNVSLVQDPAEGALVTRGNATQLHQLAMNLCTNAIHAMPEGGEVRLRLDTIDNESETVMHGGVLARGRFVRLRVEDQGVGIAAEHLPRLFEPFFTTRPTGQGTGLGLVIAHGVAAGHGGAIDVASAPGAGTCFSVYLPSCDEPVVAEESPESLAPALGRGEPILVVDDEAGLVELAQDMLAELGYEAVGFTSAARALAAVAAAPQRFAAVLTDEAMPDMAGTELCERLRAQGYAGPVIIATGFGGEGFEARAARAGAFRTLKKPYRSHEVSGAIAAGIAAAGEGQAAGKSAQTATVDPL